MKCVHFKYESISNGDDYFFKKKDLCSDLHEVSHDNFSTSHTYFLCSQEPKKKPTHFNYYIMFPNSWY